MCMIDCTDEFVEVIRAEHRKARTIHKCSECRRDIQPGEQYLSEFYTFEGEGRPHKTCLHCEVVREWLLRECGGFVYEAIAEDIREHAEEDLYGVDVKMMAVGITRRWQRRSGGLWRLPGAKNSGVTT